MASFGAPNGSSGSPRKGQYGHASFRQSASSSMTTSFHSGANSSSPMGSDVNDVPGHRTDQPATGRSLFDPETGTCTPAPRRRGRITEFLSAASAPRNFSGFAPPYVGGGSMDHDIDSADDNDSDWEDDEADGGVPASFLGGWGSGTGQQQEDDEKYWDDGEVSSSDDDEDDVDSEGEALPRAPLAKRGQK